MLLFLIFQIFYFILFLRVYSIDQSAKYFIFIPSLSPHRPQAPPFICLYSFRPSFFVVCSFYIYIRYIFPLLSSLFSFAAYALPKSVLYQRCARTFFAFLRVFPFHRFRRAPANSRAPLLYYSTTLPYSPEISGFFFLFFPLYFFFFRLFFRFSFNKYMI